MTNELLARGNTWAQVADLVKLPLSTVRGWWKRARDGMALNRRPGPRPYVPPPDVEQAIRDFFEMMGPEIGTPALKQWFPDVPRRVLQDRLRRYRQEQHETGRTTMTRLKWTRPGSVWSMDFIEAANDVDGFGNQVLVVRDLGSAGYPLLFEAMPKDGESVSACLERLFTAHGAPLVVKADNGFMAARSGTSCTGPPALRGGLGSGNAAIWRPLGSK
jgi:hypothetical protein